MLVGLRLLCNGTQLTLIFLGIENAGSPDVYIFASAIATIFYSCCKYIAFVFSKL